MSFHMFALILQHSCTIVVKQVMQGPNIQIRASAAPDGVDQKRNERLADMKNKCERLDEKKDIGWSVLKRGGGSKHTSARKRVAAVTDRAIFDPRAVATKRGEREQKIFLQRVNQAETAKVLYLLYIILTAAVVTYVSLSHSLLSFDLLFQASHAIFFSNFPRVFISSVTWYTHF